MHSRSKMWSLWHGSLTTSGCESVVDVNLNTLEEREGYGKSCTFQKRIRADRTAHIILQTLLRHSIQLLDEFIADSLHFRRWVFRTAHQALYKPSQQFVVVIRRLCASIITTSHHLKSVCQVPESGADIARERHGVFILRLSGTGGVDEFEGVKEG